MAKRVNNGSIPGYDPADNSDGYHFSKALADEACDFFADHLTFTKAEWGGQPFILVPWQRAIVRALFGWIDDEGMRRYQQTFWYLPRKNGKSELAAGVGCKIFFTDDEPGAELYSAAGDRGQAKIIWTAAMNMIKNDDVLSSRCRILTNSITIEEHGKFWQPVTSEATSKHGYNSHAIFFDEIHVQPKRSLYEALTTSMGARRQPLILYTTTADFNRKSICNDILRRAEQVRDGIIINPNFLPVIYDTPHDADWRSPKVWKKANPNYGVSVKVKKFKEAYQTARESGSEESTFKRLHLNMKTSAESLWLDMVEWDACQKTDLVPGLKSKCYSGVDLASTTDAASWVRFFPDLANLVICRFWVPEEHPEVNGIYGPWINAGFMKVTQGNVIDYDFIIKEIVEESPKHDMDPIAFDPWNARQTIIKLQEDEGIEAIEFRQGFKSLNEPTKELERMVKKGSLAHNGDPVLKWMASNVMVDTDPAGNIKPNKEKSNLSIDGISALVMAIGRWMAEEGGGESVYETRGLTTFG